MKDDYELLDSGDGRKLERFGAYTLARPCSQALWRPSLPAAEWARADASFDREDGNRWHNRAGIPKSWEIETAGIRFKLGGTDFGHLGIFPEQRAQWRWIRETVAAAKASGRAPSLLNLFAYSGGSTLAAALGGAEVCHLDASKGMVEWARENAKLNGLAAAPIRWIVDDAHKFLRREVVREDVARELAGLGLGRTRIERVGGVRENRPEGVLARRGEVVRDVRRVDRLGRAAARIAREELEDVRADEERVARESAETVRGGEMAADEHGGELRVNS